MKSSEYTIKYIGLKEGVHTFDYHVGKTFFDQYTYMQSIQGEFDIHVILEKSKTMMQLAFEIHGFINSPCDLCLENVTVPIETFEKSLIRFGEETNHFDEEIRVYGPEVFEIDLAPYFNEYIQLAIPTRIVHQDEEECNQEILTKLDSIRATKDQEIDPRWDKLKDL